MSLFNRSRFAFIEPFALVAILAYPPLSIVASYGRLVRKATS